MYWQGRIPAGSICNRVAATLDLLPTIVKITGAPAPELPIDGVDILPLLKGDPLANLRKELAYYYRRNSLEGIRKGKWKLVLPHRGQTYKTYLPGRDGKPGGYAETDVPLALYDLSVDPGETLDVQAANPEVIKEMLALAEKYRNDLGDDITKTSCAHCREAAKIE